VIANMKLHIFTDYEHIHDSLVYSIDDNVYNLNVDDVLYMVLNYQHQQSNKTWKLC
jgi:hypothetical protein